MRFRWVLLFLLLGVCGFAQGDPQYVTRTVTQYSLPPELLAKAHALYTVRTTVYFLETLWEIVLLLLVLRFRVGPRLRDLAEDTTRFRFVQALIFVSLLTLILDVGSLPFGLYGHHLSLTYGLSIQRWGSWFWDWTKSELIGMAVASVLVWLLYALMRRSPQRWWVWGWVCVMPILVFVIWVVPVVLDPVFNKFEPLAKEHMDLVEATKKIAKVSGVDVPTDRMFLMKASEKVTTANAYVTGVGSSKRVVVWDTTAKQMTVPQTTFVIGHEMGHYVLHHIDKGLAFACVTLFFGFWIVFHLIRWALERWGAQWGIRGVADWASLPALMLIASLLAFVSEPISNTFSRHIEHQADVYGLQITSQITPDYRQVAAQSFQSLGEHSLSYPYPSKLMVFWLYNHPDISSRVEFALHYEPGSEKP